MDEPFFSPDDDVRGDLVCRFLPDGTLLYGNESFIRFFGKNTNSLKGSTLLDLLPKGETEHFYHYIALLCLDRSSVTFEQRLHRYDGLERWLRWTQRGAFSVEGRLLEVHAVGQDITARKWAAEQLEKAELHYQSMIERAQEGFFQLSPKNSLIHANPALAHLLGYLSPEDLYSSLSSREAPFFFTDEGWREIHQCCQECGLVSEYEYQVTKKDGSKIWVSINIRVICGLDGSPLSYDGTMQDITNRHESKRRLVESANQISELSRIGQQVLANLEEGQALREFTTSLSALWGSETVVTISLLRRGKLVRAVVNGELVTDAATVEEGLAATALVDNEYKVDHTEIFSKIASPLRMGDKMIGAIEANRPAANGFQFSDAQLLTAAAQWAALAIHNARQHEEIHRRLQETLAMSAIRRALSETFDLERLFQLIVDSAIQISPQAQGAVIHLLETNKPDLLATAMAGNIASRIPEIHLDVEDRIISEVIQYGEIINIPDLTQDTRSDGQAHRLSMHSLLVGPVQSANGRFGTISLLSSERGAFGQDDERVLASLGLEAAIAIQNARLYQAERRQREIAEALAEAAAAFNRSLDLNEVLDCILDQTMRVIPCRIANIFLVENDQAHLVRQRINDSLTEIPQHPQTISLSLSTPTLMTMMISKQPLLVHDAKEFPGWKRVDSSAWVRSYAAAPLVIDQEIIGFLNVDSEHPDFFNQETTRSLQTFAAHAAIAIKNARLYTELENSLRQEKAMRAQLLQADKLSAMGRMASSIAHEVNNPLQAIQGCLERARVVNLDPTRRAEYLKLAEEELERLSRILQRVLDFQRPNIGTSDKVNVHKLLDNVLELSGKQLQNARIHVIREWMENLPKVQVYANQIKQVFLNLLLNATDAMPEGGTLIIRTELQTEPGNTWIKTIFTDNGSGIHPQDLDKIFEPFYSTKERGTGLGLWVSHSIILAHKGKLTVESQLGKGSTFTIWLPVVGEDQRK